MTKLIIQGGTPLQGTVRISGSKNAAVAAIPAALLASGASSLENLPQIKDVENFVGILTDLGAEIRVQESGSVSIHPNGFATHRAPYEQVKRLRASYYLLGVLLARFGRAEVALPGGCDIGPRPIDQHLKGFKALGAEVSLEHGVVKAAARRLRGAPVYLDVVSVGATINIMLAATLAEGLTTIENAAREPHIVDLANYLNAMGARVQGAGTDVIRIRGVRELHGTSHAIIPDDIEASTYLMAGVATRGDVTVDNVIPKHLEAVMAKLREIGAEVMENGDWVRVACRGRPRAANIKTLPYPGFPTDAQQPFAAVMATADGVSVIHETLYDNRFGYMNELMRMGAKVKVAGRTAVVEGVERLLGAPVQANDLRAGAALVIAGLSAEGRSDVYGVEHVERGYRDLLGKLRGLGAAIDRSPGS
ncbi:MAG TPA: UDP-N-acetylglucosamine 1-carboxyvinyltransferase [Clostridiales bacterium UBA8153]|nr:UDP-N-acetylglucosamine 1-carboxyvinyltransferase [Clostridiales bacterium UBA8153]